MACCPLRRSRVADVAITAEIATTPALFAPLRAAPLEPVRRTAGHLTAFNQDRLLLQVHSYSTGVVSLKPAAAHTLSVVIPVFQGSRTLPALLAEIDEYTRPFHTPHGTEAVVGEVLLVFDHGSDGSDATIRQLTEQYSYVRPVWLSRNFGQHPATLAGMASSSGDWIITMDEDGQHNPAEMGVLLDAALAEHATVVYGQPTNPTPHGLFRNTASWGAKAFAKLVAGDDASTHYQSYRLILGEVGRSVAAYAGAGVYLDVALGWVAGDVASAPIVLRSTEIRKSGYSFWRLLSHFWRMVISSGTRGLRLLSILGAIAMVAGVAVAIVLIVARIGGGQVPAGWTSTMVVSLITSGLILFSLGIVAEYLGVAVSMAMGKPLYLIVSDPKVGPLGRSASADPARKHQQAPRSS